MQERWSISATETSGAQGRISRRETLRPLRGGSLRMGADVKSSVYGVQGEVLMIHIILTVGAATITFALMGLGSLAGAASIPQRREALKKSVIGRTHRTGRDG